MQDNIPQRGSGFSPNTDPGVIDWWDREERRHRITAETQSAIDGADTPLKALEALASIFRHGEGYPYCEIYKTLGQQIELLQQDAVNQIRKDAESQSSARETVHHFKRVILELELIRDYSLNGFTGSFIDPVKWDLQKLVNLWEQEPESPEDAGRAIDATDTQLTSAAYIAELWHAEGPFKTTNQLTTRIKAIQANGDIIKAAKERFGGSTLLEFIANIDTFLSSAEADERSRAFVAELRRQARQRINGQS